MKSTFSVMFYLKRNGRKSNGNMPIMGRIHHDPFANYKIKKNKNLQHLL